MERVWRAAPLAALRLWPEASGLRVELNDAARAFGIEHGIDPAGWSRLAEQRMRDAGPPEVELEVGTPPITLRCRTVALPEGALLWLSPLAPAAQAEVSRATQLDTVQSLGRMGLFMRDMRSGRGYWDPHVHHIVGRPDSGESPDFGTFLREIVHPDDAAALGRDFGLALQRPGPGSTRYRIVRSDGEVRHVLSRFDVRVGTDGLPDRIVGVMIDETETVVSFERERRASQYLERAIALAGISVWHVDDATQRVRFGAGGVEFAGLERPDADGVALDRLRGTIHPDDRAAVEQATDEARRTGRVIDVIARYARPGPGNWRTLLTRRVAERDERGHVTGLAGVSLDLSALMAERSRADDLAQRTRLVSEAMGVGFWSRDNDAGSVHWDAQMMRIHQRNADEGAPSMGEWLGRHVHPSDRSRVEASLQRAQATWEPSSEATLRIATPDGSERWVRTWTRRVVRDGRRQSFGMHLDVTDQHRAEAALQFERDRYRFAVDAAGVGVWERSLDSGLRYWNEAMYRLRGFDPSDPRPLAELAALSSLLDAEVRLDSLARRHLESGEPYSGEFAVRWPDGTQRWLATRGRLLPNVAGLGPVMAGINVDITERKQADALRQEMLRAEQASRDKSAFMARASHELRTPMNAIVGFTDLLLAEGGGALDARVAQRLDRIRASAHQLLGLIDDVLDLSDLDAGQGVARDVVPVAPVIGESVALVARGAAAASVAVEVMPTDDVSVFADRARLHQVLVNLLENAVKYNRPGGWVRVSLRRSTDGPGRLGLVVQDSGRGIATPDLARIFEPFERLGAERGTIPGTGVGLTLVRRLVERMAGTVDVRSTPGVGSEFVVWLPEAHPPAPAPALTEGTGPASAPAAAAARPFVVLCVEDNAVNLQLVRELLALRPQMLLHTTDNGLDAVALAPAIVPDLVLLDMHLPDIDGSEVMRRLRAEAALARTRFIALSANAMPDHVNRALRGGFDDYWTKPIDFVQFLGSLDRMADEVAAAC
jgi:PAS domain S-box-containing protein